MGLLLADHHNIFTFHGNADFLTPLYARLLAAERRAPNGWLEELRVATREVSGRRLPWDARRLRVQRSSFTERRPEPSAVEFFVLGCDSARPADFLIQAVSAVLPVEISHNRSSPFFPGRRTDYWVRGVATTR